VGILKYAHDTDGTAVESPTFSDERERLERAHPSLSEKEHGSNNWEEQRKTVARCHADLKRKRRDFLHKLSNYYAREYDLVAVEDLDAKRLIELRATLGTVPGLRGGRSSECSNTNVNAKGRTSSP
jgi:putative transposase